MKTDTGRSLKWTQRPDDGRADRRAAAIPYPVKYAGRPSRGWSPPDDWSWDRRHPCPSEQDRGRVVMAVVSVPATSNLEKKKPVARPNSGLRGALSDARR